MTRTRLRPDDVPLGDHFRTALRSFSAMLVFGLIGASTGVFIVQQRKPLREATVSVLIAAAPVAIATVFDTGPKRLTIDTEAQRVTSARVLAPVARETGDSDPEAHIQLTAYPNTTILKITYISTNGAVAYSGAATAAHEFLAARAAALTARRTERGAVLRRQLTQLQTELQHAFQLAPNSSKSSTRLRRHAIDKQLIIRQAALRRVEYSSVLPGEIVRRAPATPGNRPNATVPPVSGLLLGGLLGLLIARGRKPRVLSRRDAARVVPGHSVNRATNTPFVTRFDELDQLGAQLMAPAHEPPRLILVATAHDEAEAAVEAVAAKLAAVLARAYPRTTLLTAGGRLVRPTGARSRPTLVLRPAPLLGPLAELESARSLVALADKDRLPIVIDGPSALTPAGTLLMSVCDVTVLVTMRGGREQELGDAAARVSGVGGVLAGVVLVVTPRIHRRPTALTGASR
jgi:hypothetical protein